MALQLVTGNLTTTLITCNSPCIGPTGYYGSVVVNTGELTMSGTYKVLVQQTGRWATGYRNIDRVSDYPKGRHAGD